MALAPLATKEKLEVLLRQPLTGDDEAWAELVLGGVSSLIREAANRTWETDPVPDVVEFVALNIAARVFRNPDAASSVAKNTGPFGRTITFADPKAVGFYLTDDEKRLVTPKRTGVAGLWTLGTTRDDPIGDTGYVPTPDGQPIPWYGPDIIR